MALGKPVNGPVSQKFAGTYVGEPPGYYTKAADGRPLKGLGTHFDGSIYALDFHKGLDIYGPEGTPLLAAEAGTVVWAGVVGTNKGIRVQIQGQAKSFNAYWHCFSFLVAVGAKVKKGQPIAKMGKTGNATGPHVHAMLEFLESYKHNGVAKTARFAYDIARFLPKDSYKWGTPYGTGYIPGGDLVNDDRIYPIRQIALNGSGVNIRFSPDTATANIYAHATATQIVRQDGSVIGPLTMPFPQINEVAGGSYSITVGGVLVTSNRWAKVILGGKTVYVAVALIHAA